MKTSIAKFEELALKQGTKITFNIPRPVQLSMDMVEASIQMAVQNLTNESIKQKLAHFAAHGTDAQKLNFVLSEGAYHLPDDLEQLAKTSKVPGEPPEIPPKCYRVCDVTWYVVCRFVGTVQECEEVARTICGYECA